MKVRKLLNILFACLSYAVLSPSAPANSAAIEPTASKEMESILDDVWAWRLERNPSLRVQNSLPVEHIPLGDLAQVEQDASFGTAIVRRLDKLQSDSLTPRQDLYRRIVRYEMQRLTEAPRYFWHGFQITPYQANFFINNTWPIFSHFTFQTPADAQRYLRLVQEHSAAVEQMLTRLKEQEHRGIRLPEAAIPGTAKVFSEYVKSAPRAVTVTNERLGALSESQRAKLQSQLTRIIDRRLVPAFRDIADHVNQASARQAPSAVGVAQYPGGPDYYRHLIQLYTTKDLTPEAVHELGLQRMAELRARMAELRHRLGFTGDQAAFHESLRADPRFVAETPEALEDVYKTCLRKLEPHLPTLFHAVPRSPYAVKRARPEAEAGMTFGYYGRPEVPGATGYYFYNGTGLRTKPTLTTCAMIYHELVPGHHFHVASQQENKSLHPLQTANYAFASYNEGWGEYGASLGVEVGAFDDPYMLYGRYLMESHVYARLVLDTGLNYFGWTLPRARAYLREATLLTDQEIETDVLRYSTDLPGQALAYGIGFIEIWRLRHHAERVLGTRFDLRDFHDVVLGSGSMPMEVLGQEVDSYIERKRSGSLK